VKARKFVLGMTGVDVKHPLRIPDSGYEAVDAPYLEYYGEEFDGRTGMGGYQIWIPIKA
jgi:predicted transcriptional regulator YdeE